MSLRLWRLVPTAACVAALAALAPPASAQKRCERAVAACVAPGAPQAAELESRQLALVIPVPAGQQGLYRQLVPAGFKAPDLLSHYQVAVYLEEDDPVTDSGAPEDGAVRSYLGFVALRVQRDDAPEAGRALEPLGRDEEGYFPVVMPVSDAVQVAALHALGLPAVLAGGSGVDGNSTQQLSVSAGNGPLLELGWTAGNLPADEASDDSKRLLLGRLPLFSVLHGSAGNERIRSKWVSSAMLPDSSPPQGATGSLQMTVNPAFGTLDPAIARLLQPAGGSFAALLPSNLTAAGVFRLAQITRLTQVKTLP